MPGACPGLDRAGVLSSSAQDALLGRDGGGEGYAPLSIFIEVLGKIQGVYVEDPNLSKVMHGALLGLLESLDPYSTYLTAEEYSRYRKTGTSGDGDIGLDLSKERSLGYIWVIHPIEGSAAAESGVKPGDIIESIDGVTTRNIGLVQAGYLLSGDVGSKVELKIRRLGKIRAGADVGVQGAQSAPFSPGAPAERRHRLPENSPLCGRSERRRP